MLKTIRYSVAAIALLVAVSVYSEPSHATPGTAQSLTTAGSASSYNVGKLRNELAGRKSEEAALKRELHQAREDANRLRSDLRRSDQTLARINRTLENVQNLSGDNYQAVLRDLNKEKSRLEALNRQLNADGNLERRLTERLAVNKAQQAGLTDEIQRATTEARKAAVEATKSKPAVSNEQKPVSTASGDKPQTGNTQQTPGTNSSGGGVQKPERYPRTPGSARDRQPQPTAAHSTQDNYQQ